MVNGNLDIRKQKSKLHTYLHISFVSWGQLNTSVGGKIHLAGARNPLPVLFVNVYIYIYILIVKKEFIIVNNCTKCLSATSVLNLKK